MSFLMGGQKTTATSTSSATEPGYNQAERRGGFANLNNLYSQLSTGPYGEGEKTAGVENFQKSGDTAMKQGMSNLAKFGRLSSGSADTLASTVGANTSSGIGNWLNQIPLLNYQAKASSLTPLLQTMASWTGTAPRGETSNSTQTTSQTSPSFGGLLSGIGMGILGGASGGLSTALTNGVSNLFGGATGTLGASDYSNYFSNMANARTASLNSTFNPNSIMG